MIKRQKYPQRHTTVLAMAWVGALALLCIAVGARADIVDPYNQSAYVCQSGDPPVKFISQKLPPGQMSTGQTANVSITVANCSGVTWPKSSGTSGFKVGSQNPQDNITWGLGRVPLPANLGTNQQITIPFTITAPTAEGTYLFQWGIVNEGVQWYKPYSPPAIVGVGTVVTCSGADTVVNTGLDASAAIQTCVNAVPPGKTLELPAGIYTLLNQVKINQSITLRTAGTAGNTYTCLTEGAPACATFKAGVITDSQGVHGFPLSRNLWDDAFGLFHIATGAGSDGIDNVAFDHIVLDGNRQYRAADTVLGALCEQSNYGNLCPNISWFGDNSKIFYSASINALMGTGFLLNGNNNVFAYNLLANNGDHFTKLRWADGLTLTTGTNATIMYNTFKDNSDVDFVMAKVTNANIQFNTIVHSDQTRYSWAGLGLDAFNSATLIDYTGANISYNTIDCNFRCQFGLSDGGHPWYDTQPNLLGGYVHHNTIKRARQGILVDGAGTAASPRTYGYNVVTNSGGYTVTCAYCPDSSKKTWTSGNFDISPDSVVVLSGGTSPDAYNYWHSSYGCGISIETPTIRNAAQFVSQSVPTTMTAGESYTVSVTMKNTGNTNWNTTTNYRLGSQNPPDNITWGGRIDPGVTDILPGAQKTFTFKVTAPSTSGTYHFQWRMVQDGVEWFGDKTTDVVISVVKRQNGAQFVSQSVPATMTARQSYTVSITMKNTGNTSWNSTRNYWLGSQNPQDNLNWGSNRVNTGVTDILTGAQKTFTFNVTAPSTSGTYHFQWRMVQDGVEWFGDKTTDVAISVK